MTKIERANESWAVEAWKSSSTGTILFLVDATGRVVWSNLDLEEHPVASVNLKSLVLAGQMPDQWLGAIAIAASQNQIGVKRIVALEKFEKSERLLAHVAAFEVAAGRLFGLEIPSPVELSPIAKGDLARATDMSPSEIKVLCHTLNGQTINDISVNLGITVETARTHMRRIYSKLGVNSRESLFSAAAILM